MTCFGYDAGESVSIEDAYEAVFGYLRDEALLSLTTLIPEGESASSGSRRVFDREGEGESREEVKSSSSLRF